VSEESYWLSFSAFPGVGPHTFKKLLTEFGSAKAAWNANQEKLQDKALGKVLTSKFVRFREGFNSAFFEQNLKKLGISILFSKDNDYPALLKQIPNPPFLLYVKGNMEILKQVQNDSVGMFGIVGTRRITEYGKTVTDMFTQSLVEAGFVIVSGLAMGVDAQAHASTIQAHGKTIAVLGCGVDCCTPPSNKSLYDAIIQHGGCIISEVPPGHLPTRGTFPSRNRIIAGLSSALLVTEGAEDSGSLITADYAFKFKRKVFAVPGPITSSLSKGPYKLVQLGAKMVVEPQEIISELGIKNQESSGEKRKVRSGSRDEKKILRLLENEALHFDDLVRKSKMNSSRLGSLLSLMEVKGMVKSQNGGMFAIID